MSKLTVLITGASGQHGGAIARRLLERGHQVRAYTRKADAPAAQELRKLGAQIVTGGFEDAAALEQAARGTDVAFLMGTPYEAGIEAETRQGLAAFEAIRRARPGHVVYSSVANADKNTGIPHFDSKVPIERAVAASGLPYTIVAPVFFMDNLRSPWWLPGLQQGAWTLAMPRGRKLQQVPVADLGRFGAHVIENHAQFQGQRIDIASDELSGEEVVAILSKVSGRTITYQEIPLDAVRASNEDFARMLEWFDKVGYSADIAGLRQRYPEVGWHTFEQWAKAQDWSMLNQPVAG